MKKDEELFWQVVEKLKNPKFSKVSDVIREVKEQEIVQNYNDSFTQNRWLEGSRMENKRNSAFYLHCSRDEWAKGKHDGLFKR